MSMSSHLLKRAVALWKGGETTQARKIFETIIHNDRKNEKAWIWYIYSLGTTPEKIAALEKFLAIFPHHTTARKALANLKAAEPPRAPESTRVAVPLKTESPPRSASVPRSTSPSFPGILVLLGLCILLSGAIILFARYRSLQSANRTLQAEKSALQTAYATLDANHRLLAQQYAQLGAEYQSMQSQFQALQTEHQTLRTDMQTLQDTFNTLQAQHQTLQDSYNVLMNDYNYSMQEYTELKEKAIVPPYIYIRGREVRLAFLTPDQQIYHWEVPFESLEDDLRRGSVERNKILSDISYPRMTLDNTAVGESYRVIDYREFVDPSTFTVFSRYFYDLAPTEEAYIEEIWYIVAQLTAYSGEIMDTPRYPLETLLAGGGDCEDHAILFASMILAGAPSDWSVSLVYMDSDHPIEPQTMNHLIVYVDTGEEQYTVEATGKDMMEPYPDGVRGWYLEIGE